MHAFRRLPLLHSGSKVSQIRQISDPYSRMAPWSCKKWALAPSPSPPPFDPVTPLYHSGPRSIPFPPPVTPLSPLPTPLYHSDPYQAVESGAAHEDGAKIKRPAGLRPRQHGSIQVGAEALAAAAVREDGGRPGAGGILPYAGEHRCSPCRGLDGVPATTYGGDSPLPWGNGRWDHNSGDLDELNRQCRASNCPQKSRQATTRRV